MMSLFLSFNSRWKELPFFVRTGVYAGIIALLLYVTGTFLPTAVEAIYGRHIYPFIAPKLAALFALISFSLTDLSILAIVICLALFPLMGALLTFRKKQRVSRIFFAFIGWGAGILGYIFTAYIFLWGFNYLRPSLANQLQLPQLSVERQKQLLNSVAVKTNALRAGLLRDELGCVKTSIGIEETDRLLERYQNELLSKYNFPTFAGSTTKMRMFSAFWLKRGGAGIYGPFTGERNIVFPVAPGLLPFLVAHERAHFAGFAHEDMANFWGIATAWNVPSPEMQYSGWLYFWKLLPNATVGNYQLSDAVKHDLLCVTNFFRKHVGLEAQTTKELYDLWLKSQGVKTGILSYDEAPALLLRYLDQNTSIINALDI